MDFAFTQTQNDLKAAARRYLGDRYPASRTAEISDFAGDDDWPELKRQGWLDPDLGIVELALLAEEGGRALHPAPWWATAGLALPVYRASGQELPGPATLADGSDTCLASSEGAGWRLDGHVKAVVEARAAIEIIVAARVDTGVALFGVRPGRPGVSRTAQPGIDPLRESSDLQLTRAPARLLADSGTAEPLLISVDRRASALLACEAVGVAGRALDFAIEYAKTRLQFDRPIGSYQAVSQLLAESYAELELARSLVHRAACVLQDQAESAEEALACAVHASRQAAVRICEAAIQVCGGIGVTWEFPLHRWYRRALWTDAFYAGRPDPLATLAGVRLG